MMNKFISIFLLTSLFSIAGAVGCFASKSLSGQVKVGAAKVNITPGKGELPENWIGIHDSIYSRAIVIDNGTTSSALITLEIGAIPDPMWERLTQRFQNELGIPKENVLMSVSHTHSVPFRMSGEGLENKVFASVKQAKDELQPARIGWGTGVSYINVKRDIIDPVTRTWWEGPNYDGPSDKTVYVMTFESLDGKPIAVYYNYAMHAVTMGQYDMISGDVPGATSRYIENSFNNDIVAVWSEGACGDQNPIYFQQTFDLRDIRIKEYAKRGEDISNAMPPGGVGLDRNDPTVQRLMKEQEMINNSMGVMLGEEVKHVMRGVDRTTEVAEIKGAQKVLTLPGRKRTNQGRGGIEGTYVDGDSVTIRVGVLLIDDIALGTVNGETYNQIATQFIKESPYARTMMVTIANGMATTGYIPDDASFGQNVFEVLSSRLKPGYAERGIIDGILDLMEELKQ